MRRKDLVRELFKLYPFGRAPRLDPDRPRRAYLATVELDEQIALSTTTLSMLARPRSRSDVERKIVEGTR